MTETIEDLQAQLIALQAEQEKLKAESEARKLELDKATESLQKARDLNAQLVSRMGAPEQKEPEQDPYEGLSPDEALEKILPELVDRTAASMKDTKKE